MCGALSRGQPRRAVAMEATESRRGPLMLLMLAGGLFVAVAQVSTPDYLQLCSRSDPQFDTCMLQRIRNLVPNLLAGDPDLGVPALNPIRLEEMHMDQDIGDSKLKLVISNVTVSGTDSVQVTAVRSMATDTHADINVNLMFDQLNVDGSYRSDFRFRGLPLLSKGHFNINLDDVNVVLDMSGKTYERDGQTYLQMQRVNMRPQVGDMNINITNLFGASRDLNEAALDIANRYWFIFYNENLPALEQHWDPFIANMINYVLSRVPYGHIFPQ